PTGIGAAAGPAGAPVRGDRLRARGYPVPPPHHPRSRASRRAVLSAIARGGRRALGTDSVSRHGPGAVREPSREGRPSLRAPLDRRAGHVIGCLTAPFRLIGCLDLILLLAGGWLYRDRLVREGRRLLSGSEAVSDSIAVGRPGRQALAS